MTHPTQGGASLCIAPAMPGTAAARQWRLDRNILRHGIGARRCRLAELEAAMVNACERAAARGASRSVRIGDQKTWDKAAWQRYLDEAARLEPYYMPEMRRLLQDIDRFERLLTLPIATEAGAATTGMTASEPDFPPNARELAVPTKTKSTR